MASKGHYKPINEGSLIDGCYVDINRENVWWNRIVKSLVFVALMSISTWAVLRANTNGSLSEIFSSKSHTIEEQTDSKPYVSLTDSALQHEWNHQEDGEWSTASTSTTTTPQLNGGLIAIATNEYSKLNNKMFPYPFLQDAILVEPYKETTITINGINGNTFYWSIVKKSDPTITFHGTSDDPSKLDFTVTLTELGQYVLTVEEQFDGMRDISSMRTLKQSIWVKYVRRELSTLTDTDREEFLNAMHLLWDVSSKKGSSKYTDRFKSLSYFALIHNDGGGNFICDEFRGGTGSPLHNTLSFCHSYLDTLSLILLLHTCCCQLLIPLIWIIISLYSEGRSNMSPHTTNANAPSNLPHILCSRIFEQLHVFEYVFGTIVTTGQSSCLLTLHGLQ